MLGLGSNARNDFCVLRREPSRSRGILENQVRSAFWTSGHASSERLVRGVVLRSRGMLRPWNIPTKYNDRRRPELRNSKSSSAQGPIQGRMEYIFQVHIGAKTSSALCRHRWLEWSNHRFWDLLSR